MNKRIDEFGGLRESTYRDYALTPKELLYHTLGLFLPAYFIYSGIRWGFERKLRLMEIPRDCTKREFVEIEEWTMNEIQGSFERSLKEICFIEFQIT